MRPTKVYSGVRDPNELSTAGDCIVYVDGVKLRPDASQRVRNHSPTGFNWGYSGSGPAQLALAILLDHFGGDKERAQRHYQTFKFKIVAGWPQDNGWVITSNDIDRFIAEQEKE
jgi:hypothetical protein